MTDLRTALENYLSMRKGLGYKYEHQCSATIWTGRIASSRDAPERLEHCLTRMLPKQRPVVKRRRPDNRAQNAARADIGWLRRTLTSALDPTHPDQAGDHVRRRLTRRWSCPAA